MIERIHAMAVAHRPYKDLITERLRNSATPNGLTVHNETDKAVLRIYDEIGFFGITADDVAAALADVTADEIEVQINSIGGDVFDGVAIYNTLRSHPARITTRVDSMAASIASVIAQAGDHRIMLTGSQMMIHDAWGLAIGNADIMHTTGDLLDKQSDIIAAIYAERSGKNGFRDLMLNESWFDHTETVEAGLADEVVKPSKQTKNQINPPSKFADQLAEAVASLESVAAEAENVMTFRSEQGKPPLSDDAVVLVGKAQEALTRFQAESDTPTTPEVVEARKRHIELLELEVAQTQGIKL